MKYLENKYIVFGIIAILVLVVYGKSYDFGFLMDDTIYITKNNVVNELEWGNALTKSSTYGYLGDNDGAYRPVYLLSLLLNKTLFGSDSVGYHIVQIGLYLVLSILVYSFFNSVLKFDFGSSLLLCALFIMLPVHVEVVSNIKSRDELLAVTFFVGSLIVSNKAFSSNNIKYLIASVSLFFFAVFSKESVMPCVLVFPVVYVLTNEQGVMFKLKSELKSTIWYLAPIAVMLSYRLFYLDFTFIENQHITNPINNMLYASDSKLEQFLTALYYQWFYFKQILVPYPLLHEYSLDTIKIQTLSSLGGYLGGGLILVLVYSIYHALKRRENILLLGLLIYALGFVLTSNLFIRIPANVSDRFMFLPSFGLIIVLGHILNNRVWLFKQFMILTTVIYFLISFNRIDYWKDEISLFSRDVEISPEGARLNAHLASAFYEQSKEVNLPPLKKKRYLLEAKSYFERSEKIAPFSTPTISYQLGNVCYRLKDYPSAKKYYNITVGEDSSNIQARINLGVVHKLLGELVLARDILSSVYQIRSRINERNIPILISNLAMVNFKLGEFSKSKDLYRELLKRYENRPDDWNSLGVVYTKLSSPYEARDCFRKAYSLRPSDKTLEANFRAYDEYVKRLGDIN